MTSSLYHSPEPQIGVLGGERFDAVLEFLSRDIVKNVFMLSWAQGYGIASQSQQELFHFAGVETDGLLQAVSLVVTRRLVLLDALGQAPAKRLGEWYGVRGTHFEHIVSARENVTPFWAGYQNKSGHQARLDRLQQLYVLERDTWLHEPFRHEPTDLRLAQIPDLDAVFLASARMHAEETLEDPLERNPRHFRRHVEHRIQSDRTWVFFNDRRRLMFKADVSAQSQYGAQISGVYTPPALRGQGIATRCIADMCEALFDRGFPRITLYVNEDNIPAIHVYERVGFKRYCAYETVFVAE